MIRTNHLRELERIEHCTLAGIDAADAVLDGVLRALAPGDASDECPAVALCAELVARCRETQAAIVTVIARQAPVAGDLRMLLALVDANRRIEGVGDQIVTIAAHVPRDIPDGALDVELLDDLVAMGELVREQLQAAKRSFAMADVALAERLRDEDLRVDRLEARVVRRGVQVGTTRERRQWAIDMVLIASCLERAGGHAVGIARHAASIGRRPRGGAPLGASPP